jgi:hypothetical protein
VGDPPAPAFRDRQAAVAHLLTEVAPPPADAAAPFGVEAVARTRSVLQHKRVDEALPLLPRLRAMGGRVLEVAFRTVRSTARAPRAAGIADALRIAEAASADPELAGAALRDRLELRSRFAARAGEAPRAPRRGPFVGCERLPGGRTVWALKSVGADAPVRIIERGGRG